MSTWTGVSALLVGAATRVSAAACSPLSSATPANVREAAQNECLLKTPHASAIEPPKSYLAQLTASVAAYEAWQKQLRSVKFPTASDLPSPRAALDYYAKSKGKDSAAASQDDDVSLDAVSNVARQCLKAIASWLSKVPSAPGATKFSKALREAVHAGIVAAQATCEVLAVTALQNYSMWVSYASALGRRAADLDPNKRSRSFKMTSYSKIVDLAKSILKAANTPHKSPEVALPKQATVPADETILVPGNAESILEALRKLEELNEVSTVHNKSLDVHALLVKHGWKSRNLRVVQLSRGVGVTAQRHRKNITVRKNSTVTVRKNSTVTVRKNSTVTAHAKVVRKAPKEMEHTQQTDSSDIFEGVTLRRKRNLQQEQQSVTPRTQQQQNPELQRTKQETQQQQQNSEGKQTTNAKPPQPRPALHGQSADEVNAVLRHKENVEVSLARYQEQERFARVQQERRNELERQIRLKNKQACEEKEQQLLEKKEAQQKFRRDWLGANQTVMNLKPTTADKWGTQHQTLAYGRTATTTTRQQNPKLTGGTTAFAFKKGTQKKSSRPQGPVVCLTVKSRGQLRTLTSTGTGQSSRNSRRA